MLSLPILLFFGLPASVANGTNRLGLSPGMLSSVLGLKKKGYFPFAQALRIAPPVIVGALAGSFLAVRIPDEQLKLLIAILIIVLSVLIFMDSYGKVGNSAGDGKGYFQKSLLKQSATVSSELQLNWKQGWYLGRLPTIVYMLVGFYGSFLQIGDRACGEEPVDRDVVLRQDGLEDAREVVRDRRREEPEPIARDETRGGASFVTMERPIGERQSSPVVWMV